MKASRKRNGTSTRQAHAPLAVRLNDPEKLQIRLLRFGVEKNPVLVVDNVLRNPDEVREYALGAHYSTPRWDYPGYQSSCVLRGVRELTAWAAGVLWTEGFNLSDPEANLRGIDTESFFGAFAPSKMHRYSNIRTDAHSWLELTVHLTPGEEDVSGTGFWQHRPTGLESACNAPAPHDRMLRLDKTFKTRLVEGAERVRRSFPHVNYEQWVSMVHAPGIPPPFPAKDYGPWKNIGSVDALFNRLVAFPTWQFHSVIMKRDVLASSLETARLTLTSFIRHPLLERLERLPTARMEGIDVEADG
jgi:hypothetical protein